MSEKKLSNHFPSTRFQGSKRRYSNWIMNQLIDLDYETVLDPFCGTCAISYAFKELGKTVFCNDILRFNHIIGKALIENNNKRIGINEAKRIIIKKEEINYDNYIQKKFKNIFYLDNENQWIDVTRKNIQLMKNPYKQALCYFALFQSCLIKRPYNLFHRKNLYFRTYPWKKVKFGNKVTWERPFSEYFLKFVNEANNAIFSNNRNNKSLNFDALGVPNNYEFDLVYLDPPYMNIKGRTPNYLNYYHFLEGLVMSNKEWGRKIDKNTLSLKMKLEPSPWRMKTQISNAFEILIKRYQNSIIIISYRDPGIPSINQLKKILKKYKNKVKLVRKNNKFALANNNINIKKNNKDISTIKNGLILLIGTD